jgi:hypothetical protein
MQAPNESSVIISRTFFVSQLVAMSVYGVAAAFGNLAANDLLQTMVVVAAVVVINGLVFGLRLPSSFAKRLSARALSALAIVTSLVLMTIAFSDVIAYFDLPADFLTRAGVQRLRLVSFVGLGAFGLAFIANVVAAASASKVGSRLTS